MDGWKVWRGKRRSSQSIQALRCAIEQLEPRLLMAVITGLVFEDSDADGIHDAGELGLASRRVFDDANNDLIWQAAETNTLTDVGGSFVLNLLNGTHSLRVVPFTSSWVTIAPASGSQVVTVSGSDISGRDFGIARYASMTGVIYNDLNFNNVHDAGESGVSGRRVYLDSDHDFVWDNNEVSVLSDASGIWMIDKIIPGTLTWVPLDRQFGWAQTQPYDSAGESALTYAVTSTSGFAWGAADYGTVYRPFFGAPALLPGKIEAEDFDKGGNGIVYHDLDLGDNGGAYRANSRVHILIANDGGAGFKVGNVRAGEWIEYTVDVAAAGIYTAAFRVASNGAGGTFHLEANGVSKTTPISVPNTGDWNVYQTLTRSVQLDAGPQTFRLAMDSIGASGWVADFNWIQLTSATIGSVSGTVYEDVDGDGVRDAGEPALVDRLVYADANNNGTWDVSELNTLTNAGGGYTLTGLANGTYNIRLDPLTASWLTITPASGFHSVVINGGSQFTGKDFGAARYATMTGSVYNDLNFNNGRDAGENGLADWRIYVDADLDGVFDPGETFVLSDALGNWVLNLRPGVESKAPLERQSGWTQTQPYGSGQALTYVAPATTTSGFAWGAAHYGVIYRPFTGTPAALPGKIELENFDKGLEGIVYHDLTDANEGGVFRATGVDLLVSQDSGGGFDVGWARAGEWIEYTVNVANAGVYTLEFRVSSPGNGGTFHVEFGGVNKSGTMSIPNTGDWFTYQTISATNISLATGLQTMRLVMDSNNADGWVADFNWMRVVAPDPGAISGALYLDSDQDGIRDAGEGGLNNWQVYLDLNNNGIREPAEPSTQTNGSGNYSFAALALGSYTVRAVGKPGWTAVNPASASQLVNLTAANPTAGGRDFCFFGTGAGALITWNLSFNDPGGAWAAYYNDITRIVQAAGREWNRLFDSDASIEVAVDFTMERTASASSFTDVHLRNQNGLDIRQFGVPYEINTGIDPNGASPDMDLNIGVNPTTVNYLVDDLWFDPDPAARTTPIPAGKTDAMSVMMHEIGHTLGYNGFRNWQTAQLPGNSESTFDQYVTNIGQYSYFTGPNAHAVYGSDPALTDDNIYHWANHAPGPGNDLQFQLMTGIGFFTQYRFEISDLDVAVMKDVENILENKPPLLVDKQFNFNTGTSITLAFNESVRASLALNDMTLVRTGAGGATIPSANLALSYNRATNTATISFIGLGSGGLADGNYQLSIARSGVTDLAGNSMPADQTLNFFVLKGDLNRDRQVTISDFITMASNFAKTNVTYADGDVNYDGMVSISDFIDLSANFNHTLAPPPATAPQPADGVAITASESSDVLAKRVVQKVTGTQSALLFARRTRHHRKPHPLIRH